MFVLEILLGLRSIQGDITSAFLHTDLEEKKTAHVDTPMRFAKHAKNRKKCSLNSRRHSMGYNKVLEHSGSSMWPRAIKF
jgi:hypothetical protein